MGGSRVCSCSEFEEGWSRALDRAGTSEFHATDFDSLKGEFENWRPNYKKHFYDHLVSLLVMAAPLHVGVAVLLADYATLEPEDKRALGSPPVLCAYRCFELVAEWLRPHTLDPVAHVVDEGGGYESELLAAYQRGTRDPDAKRRLHLDSLVFGDSKKILPLQAADWAAYERAKQVRAQRVRLLVGGHDILALSHFPCSRGRRCKMLEPRPH